MNKYYKIFRQIFFINCTPFLVFLQVLVGASKIFGRTRLGLELAIIDSNRSQAGQKGQTGQNQPADGYGWGGK